ncbi:MAG TPA: polysaccharide biosynthesis tyrosine autokinase, partial [Abditibacterium sp.]
PRSVGTQLAIMRSYPVQRATLKRLSPQDQEVAKKYHKLDVRPQRDSEAIDIVAESYEPQVAANLANALSQEYMAQYQQQNKAQVSAGTSEVAGQLAGAKQRLDEAATALKNYKLANRTIDLSEEARAKLGQINQIEGALRDLQSQRAANRAEIEVLTRQIAAMPQVEVIPERIVRRPALETLQGQLTTLELQRIATLRRYRPGTPEVRAIEQQRRDIQARLRTMAQTQVSSWIRSVNPIRQGLVQRIASIQAQIWALDARARALQNSARLARQQQALLPEREYRLNQLSTEQAVLQQTYQVLNEKYQSLLVSEGARLASARPLAPAEPPTSPIRPRRALNLAMSLLLGIVAALALALLVDRIDDHINSAQDAAGATQLPVLSETPYIESPDERSLLGPQHQRTILVHRSDASEQRLAPTGAEVPLSLLESYRSLRTKLMLAAPSGPRAGNHAGHEVRLPHSVLVSSSREGEGKSLCALNLAIAAAHSGTKVVLLDCNLRQPTLHTLLHLPMGRGLTDVLTGSVSLEDALQETGVPNLRILTGGTLVDNAPQLLDTNAARQVLGGIVSRAEFAVLDGPSLSAGADTPILATIAETALLVVASESAEGAEVAHARDVLAQTGVHLLGLVWNNTQPAAAPFASPFPSPFSSPLAAQR